jgi:class 3 adenylate cyclase
MADPSTILVVDDDPETREALEDQLTMLGYRVVSAETGEAALDRLQGLAVDLAITDVHMGGMSGIELCSRVKSDPRLQLIPVILLTGAADLDTRVAGLGAGADDVFAKPVSSMELRTRVASLLRVKALLDTTKRLYDTIQSQAEELAEGKRTLEDRVQAQLAQLERLGRLKRLLSPQLAELIVNSGEDPLKTHRSEVTVVFVDLRGFTAFAEMSEPEEVMGVLQEYHAAMGTIIVEHEGTLERYTGDGMMILFNDPVPVDNPAERAIRMALAMRERSAVLSTQWHRRGYALNFGLGIAQGYATIGTIGFEGRSEYTAIGTVVNLAARLCGVAQPGQILVPQRLLWIVEDMVEAEHVADFELKGFHLPVPVYNLVRLKA